MFCSFGLGPHSRSGSGSKMPDFRNAIRAQLEKNSADMPKGPMKQMMETYKPHILTRRRQLIEDCVRDLRLNNDHIHIVEQEMRIAIQVSFPKIISGKIIFLWYFLERLEFYWTWRFQCQMFSHIRSGTSQRKRTWKVPFFGFGRDQFPCHCYGAHTWQRVYHG